MKTMILVGSSDIDSHSLYLGLAIEQELKALNQEVEIINLVDYGLPLYDRRMERDNQRDEKTRAFLYKSLGADSFVWITPIYHNSYSVMLKNALDWQHSTKFPERVVGLASNGGNRSPQAVDQLMLVARSQGMLTIPTRVCTDESDYDNDLNLSEPGINQRVKGFCVELISMTTKLGGSNV